MLKAIISLLFSFLLATFQLQAQETIQGAVREAIFEFVENDCPFDGFDTPLVECGTLTVPQDRSLPDGQQVQIAVAIFPAVGEDPVEDPLFYLDGGPGAASLQRWGDIFNDYFSEFNQTRDVVIVDYRGAGESEPSLYCDEVLTYYNETYGQETDSEASRESYGDALDACWTRLVEDEHVDFDMYNSAVIAEDISDLREALGYDEINLLGVSYGTRLALTLLRDRPQGIRSVILDGVYPPQVNFSAETLLNMNRAFEELFDSCAQTPACNAAFPNLRAEFYTVAKRLNEEPIKMSVDTGSYEDGYVLPFNGNSFINFIFGSLYSTSTIPALPLIIHQAAEGNYAQLPRIVGAKLDSDMGNSLGLYLAIQCSEEYPFNDFREILAAEEVPLLSSFLIRHVTGDISDEIVIDRCDAWGTDTPNPVENEAVRSDVPVLILNGQFDPITPPRWGELAAETLVNSQSVTFPGVGHGASLSGSVCAQFIALNFLETPETALNTSCIEDTPLDWVTVDLTDSLMDIEATAEHLHMWKYDTYVSSPFWNATMWSNYDDRSLLRIVDWVRSAYPETPEKAWFEQYFAGLGSYQLEQECSLGDLSLYEFSFGDTYGLKSTGRYWVDMRDPDKVRDVFLSLGEESLKTLELGSEMLFPELPRCG